MPRRKRLPPIVLLLALLWGIQLINALSDYALNSFGIIPRTLSGLSGIPFAPLLHGSWSHLLGNSVPLLILGALVSLQGTRRFLMVTLLIALLAGLGTWLVGSTGVHIGASSLVFGYFGYLIARAFFLRDCKSILIAGITLLLYGGLFLGLADLRSHISWSGHFSGLLAGALVARGSRKPKR